MNGVRNGNPRSSRGSPPAGGRNEAAPRRRQNASASNASRNYERYVALGREAARSGDVIEAENFYQHAEHYFREMSNRTA
jgi:Domain of unknown function (DUF4167)